MAAVARNGQAAARGVEQSSGLFTTDNLSSAYNSMAPANQGAKTILITDIKGDHHASAHRRPRGRGQRGTKAALLAEHFNIPTISTGDIFRYNIKNKTELGLEAMSYTDKGELVPDSLTNKIVKDRLAKEDCKNGWILDGYPRNAAQVTALDEMLADLDTPLDHVVALEAARDVLLERMKKRAAEQGRADDTPEAIAKRLETYEKETAPLLDIYEARGLLVVVNGVGDIDEISGRIISHLE